MSDNDGLVDFQQRQEALNCSASYIIQAPAGSGKTGVLTQRILGLLALVEKPEEVVAITFTKKAAGEMRQRVLESLMAAKGQVCPENPYDAQTWHLSQAVIGRDQAMGWDLLRYPNRLKIQTIDGFCGSLVKQMPFESSMGSMPAIEEDASLVYEKAAKQLLNSVGEGEFYDKALTSLLKHLDNNYRLAVSLIAQMLSKRDHWLENVMSVRSHDDLKYRMEESLNAVIDDQINAINNSVPSDIRQQLMSLSLYAAQNLQAEGHESPIRAALEYENDAGFIDTPQAWVVFSELLLTKGKPNYRKRLDAKTGFPAPTGSKNAEEKQLRKERKDNAMALIALLEEELPGFNDRLYEVKNLPLAGYSDEQWALLVDLLDLMPVAVGYLNLMWQSSGSVDFTEISMAALRSLGSAEEPTDLILKYDHRISHLLVDEFQDTSILQIQLLEKLTSGWQQGDGRTLFLVGDPMQGIYSFRKADIGLFLSVWHERRLADVTLTPLKLETNFRSDQKVIHWVNNVFSSAFPRQDDSRVGAVSYSHSVAAKSGGEKAGVSLKIFQQNTIDKNLENEDDQFEYPDKEAEYIAQTIEALREKDQANNKRYAVLVRSKSHAKPIINKLQARNIPIRAVDIDTLQESPVIQQLLGLTRALLRPSDRVGWYSVLRGACVGLTLSSLEKLHSVNIYAPIWDNLSFVVNRIGEDDSVDFDDAEANKLKQVVALFSFYYNKRKQFNVRDAIESLWLNLGGYLADPSLQARNDAEKYFALLETFEDSGDLANIQALEQKAMSLFSSPGSVDPSAVQIMSMHKSKGLEFDYVFLPYAAKRGRGDDRPLLIVDNQLSPATGQQALFLAALPERGGDAQGDAVYEFLWSTHSAKLKNELSRLTYVACTRAKQHLYITGTLGTDKKDNIKPPSGGTILGSLWAGVEMNNLLNDVSLVDPVVKAIQQRRPISVFNDDTVSQIADYQASVFGEKTQKPNGKMDKTRLKRETESDNMASVDAAESQIEPIVDLDLEIGTDSNEQFYANVGTFAHRIYKQFCDSHQVTISKDQIASLHPLWKASLKKLAIKPEQMDKAIALVDRAVLHLINNPDKARWLFQRRDVSGAELAVSRVSEKGDGEHFVIDRTFIDEQGIRWVVDYKFSDTDGDIGLFVGDQFSRYRQQLENYASLMKTLDGMNAKDAKNESAYRKTHLMLYFPLLDQSYCWSIDDPNTEPNTDIVRPFA